MIRIQVTNYNGASLSQLLFAEFSELGGNIGRAEGNALVLHDPTRTISRIHASVEFREGSYSIRNLGTAIPVYVNGQSLSNGQHAAIAAGDEIRIGGYIMQVASGESGSQLQSNPLSKARRGNAPPRGNLGVDGPAPVTPASSGIIPSDFDPFAPMPSPVPQPRPFVSRPRSSEPEDILDGWVPVIPNKSIDELWDLRPETSPDPFAPGNPLAPPPNPSNTASVDPLVALNAVSERKPSGSHVQRDDVPEWESSFRPQEAKPDPAMREISLVIPQTSNAASSEPGSMVLSWVKESDKDTGEIKSLIVPSPTQERRRNERRRSEQRAAVQIEAVSEKTTASATDIARASEAATIQVAPVNAPVDSPSVSKPIVNGDALLRGFLEGAGVPDLVIPGGLTPQFMNILGQLLRESTQGTLDLLRARTALKQEMNVDLTMIAPEENNQLKFSLGVDVALRDLLVPQGRGIMTPLQAMKDAHDALRYHQFGVLAGMRAALAGVLKRFDPGELERQFPQKTVIDSLIAINRKAKLWDLSADRYKSIARDAEEDFRALFGKEFLRGYEAQIAKLEQDDKNVKH